MSRSKLVFGILLNVALFGCALFLPAGTFDWWRAWVFLGITLMNAVTGTVILYRSSEELLKERFKPMIQKGQPLADKIIVVPLITAFIGLIVFIPFDVFRFHLLPKPAPLVSSAGLLLCIAGWWIMILAMLANAFAAPVIKLQEERHQKVADSGVYRVVRHPMYSGAILFLLGIALWLESYAAAILAIVPTMILVARIFIEERFLRRGLAGYDAYTRRVRYRLIPLIW